jgi:eukaryotic-like serine/threonine-protein kinase
MPIESHNVRSIFDHALDLTSEADRRVYLDEVCATSSETRQKVEALLKAYAEAGNFLQEPAIERPQTEAFHPTIESAGTQIGPYKLLEQIGEGGMGVVYMADLQKPVRRRVALKIIKAGMDTRQVIARFEAERQALALMDHSNIARVLDAGATDSGRPYFVMELVRGIPITEYCDQNNLPVHERLELFVQVCHAVQHAHQKGIIHRDIKPANVLVTLHDGRPVPKVIDFGVAKATNQQLTEKTLFTAFAQMVGTPLYMSPEQAEMSGLDIDTRSDIYSLGVLLYELLTGTTPFDQQRFREAAYAEMVRIIREEEPPKPSTRISTLGAARTATAAHRQIAGQRLGQLMKGDLDWIVMKALEKDRTRRYDTANGLAADVDRYLQDEPVVARPPTSLYRFQKLVRRNKLAVAATGAVIAALVIGLGFSGWLLLREKEARQRAVAAEQAANTEAAKSAQVAEFMKDMLMGVGPSVALGRDNKMLLEILDKTASRVGHDLKDQPLVQAELLDTIGPVYQELAQYEKSEAMLREGLSIRRKVLGSEHLDVAKSLNNLGLVLHRAQKLTEAEAAYREALAIQTKLLGSQNSDVARTQSRLGSVLRRQGNADEAESLLRSSLDTRKNVLGQENPEVASSLRELALLLSTQSKYAEAERLLRQALAMQTQRPDTVNPAVADLIFNLGKVLERDGKFPEAEVKLRDSLAMQRKLYGDEHPDVAESLGFLAKTLSDQDKLAEAETMYRENLAMRRKLSSKENIVTAQNDLAAVLRKENKLVDLAAIYREVAEQGDVKAQTDLAGMYLRGEGVAKDSAEAMKWYRKAGDISAVQSGPALQAFGDAALQAGELDVAEKAFRQGVQTLEEMIGTSADKYQIRIALNKCYRGLYEVFNRSNQIEESTEAIHKAIAVLDRAIVDFPKNRQKFLQQQALNYRYLSFQLSDQRVYAAAREALNASTGFFRESAKSGDLKEKATCEQGEADNFQRIGNHWQVEGRGTEAHEAYRQALAVQERIEEQDHAQYIKSDWVTTHYVQLVEVLALVGTPEDALRIAHVLRPPKVKMGQRNWQGLLRCHLQLGLLLQKGGNSDEASQQFDKIDQVVAEMRGNPKSTADDWAQFRESANFLTAAREATKQDTRLGEAQRTELVEKLTSRAKEVLADYMNYYRAMADKGDADSQYLLADAYAGGEGVDQNWTEALKWYRLAADQGHSGAQHTLGSMYAMGRGVVWDETEAAKWYRKVAEHRRKNAERGDAESLNDIAWLLATCEVSEVRDGPAAVSFAEKAVAATNRKRPGILDTLAAAYAEAHQFANAVRAQKEAIALQDGIDFRLRLSLYEDDTPYRDRQFQSIDDSVIAERDHTKLAAAEILLRQQLRDWRPRLPVDDRELADLLAPLVHILLVEEKFVEAEPLARECLEIREKKLADDWRTFNAKSMLGGSLLGLKKYAEAEPLLVSGYEGMDQRVGAIPAAGKLRLKQALQRIAQLYEDTDQADKAAPWKAKLAEVDNVASEKSIAARQP